MKFKQKYLVILCSLMLVSLGIANFLKHRADNISPNILNTLKIIVLITCVLPIVGLLGYIAKCIISIFRNAISNTSKLDDPFFDQIDQFNNHWKDSDSFYLRRTQAINHLYRDNGELDQLVKNKELRRLYARKDFLSNQDIFYETLMTSLIALVISFLASCVYQIFFLKIHG